MPNASPNAASVAAQAGRRRSGPARVTAAAANLPHLADVEFHRHAVAVATAKTGKSELYISVLMRQIDRGGTLIASCTCSQPQSKRKRCLHVRHLMTLYQTLVGNAGTNDLDHHLGESSWMRVLAPLAAHDPVPLDRVEVHLDRLPDAGTQAAVVIKTPDGVTRAQYRGSHDSAVRLSERLRGMKPSKVHPIPRAGILRRLQSVTESAYESQLRSLGHQTEQQELEASLWHRLAYHCYREYSSEAVSFALHVDEQTGGITLEVHCSDTLVLQLPLARNAVRALLVPLRMQTCSPKIADVSVEPKLRVSAVATDAQGGSPKDNDDDGTGAIVEPVITPTAATTDTAANATAADSATDPNALGPNALDPIVLQPRFRYADAAYVPEMGTFVELDRPGPVAQALHLVGDGVGPRTLKHEEIPLLLAAAQEQASSADGPTAGPPPPGEVLDLPLIHSFDTIEIHADALQRDWCWLSMHYGTGDANIPLEILLRARRRGERFVEVGTDSHRGALWVDLHAPQLSGVIELADNLDDDAIEQLMTALAPGNARSRQRNHAEGHPRDSEEHAGNADGDNGDGPDRPAGLRLSRMELLRILVAAQDGYEPSTDAASVTVTTSGRHGATINRLLAIEPNRPLKPLAGLGSTLRDYQEQGVNWLLFLHDNRFGGLLCDDMGLGKTHQVMAFMLALREQRQVKGPFLVVCPTTVLSHWQRVLARYAPDLRACVFHGGTRNLQAAMQGTDVLLTSYGIMRNDIDDLAAIDFAVVAFDEAQYLKNPETLGYRAAVRLNAGMRLGLSGTPIENSLWDLKALFDLSLPRYLPGTKTFDRRFVAPIEHRNSERAREQLRHIISPFILRRTKSNVLDQLPGKIEDLRACELSEEQVKLYREAVEARGKALREALANPDEPVPYVHIFALLTLLKQICCHPALIGERSKHYSKHSSGKWELFTELLDECLGSGQKVVVYSQFRGMVAIIERHLQSLGVGFATLTGQTRDRGGAIARFADDDDCRVFVATLQAGGVGIDLVSASVVIHYDRWWNAAREDQATDRVHRMGQTRGVHVLKLITSGTLEEKIAAIIDKKRDLLDSVIAEDDTGTMKSFSRDELMTLLLSDGVGMI